MTTNKKHVTLIAPPVYTKNPSSSIYISLGLTYIASFLRHHGHDVKIIDAVIEDPYHTVTINSNANPFYLLGSSLDDILKAIPRDTDYIGISVPFNSNATIAHELIKKIKHNFNSIPIIVGGSYASSLPEEALRSGAQYVIKGEGEIPMLHLLNGASPLAIEGIISKENLNSAQNNFAECIANLDDIAFPAYDLIPIDNYIHSSITESKGTITFPIMASRGCPHSCAFCVNHTVYNHTWRSRTIENVLAEIHFLINKYNATRILFLDENLLANKQYTHELFDEMIQIRKEQGGNFRWHLFSGFHLKTLDYSMLEKIKESGCNHIILPIEHGDPALLKKMNKVIDLEKTKDIIKSCTMLGVKTTANHIVGYPGETKKSFSKSMRFFRTLKKMGLKNVTLYKTKPFPATALYDYCKKNNLLAQENAPHTYFLTHTSPLLNTWVGVTTKDFDAQEVNRRYRYAHRILNSKPLYQKMLSLVTVFKNFFFKKVVFLKIITDNRSLKEHESADKQTFFKNQLSNVSRLFRFFIFSSLPFPYQYGASFSNIFVWLKKSQWYSLHQIEEYQNKALQKIIRHAYANIPYYRNVFDEKGIRISQIRTKEDLTKLPLLTKACLRENYNDFIWQKASPHTAITRLTSGSTGEPLEIKLDYITNHTDRALYIRHWYLAGYRYGKRILSFRPYDRFSKKQIHYDCKSKILYLNPFVLTQDTLTRYVAILKDFKPEFINTHPITIDILRRHLHHKRNLPCRLKAIFTLGSTPYPLLRNEIETFFECRIFDWYGMNECIASAYECEQHQGYHINFEQGILEVIRDNDSGKRELVATTLLNKTMPLIRYSIGDEGEISSCHCSCGRKSFLLKNIQGRKRDCVITPDKRILTGVFFNSFIHSSSLEWALQIQFLQENIDTLIIKTVNKYTPSTEQKNEFIQSLKPHLGERMKIELCFVDTTEVKQSGKRNLVISKVPLEL